MQLRLPPIQSIISNDELFVFVWDSQLDQGLQITNKIYF